MKIAASPLLQIATSLESFDFYFTIVDGRQRWFLRGIDFYWLKTIDVFK